jgi:4-hydroxy-tetrahydrodipicolinate synthase
VTPYYNKPSQAGLYDHFIQVAQAVNCPVILYNVPGRTGVGISPETVAKLALNPKIRAIKEASGNVAFSSDILDACRSAGTSIEILSGDDATYLPALAVGATGVISVASNLFPRAMVEMKNAWNAKQPDRAMELHQQYYPLFRDLFIESNPTPIKTALSWVGMGLPQVRPPLNPLSESSLKQLQASLVACGFSRQGGTR